MKNSSLEYHIELLKHVRTTLVALPEEGLIVGSSHNLFLERFDELLELLLLDFEQSHYLGQELVSQIFHRYPQVGHLVPRDLLWFFGGDCLHFMPDEEIAQYQKIDDYCFEMAQCGRSINWAEAKQKII